MVAQAVDFRVGFQQRGRKFLDLSSWQASLNMAAAQAEGYEGIIVKRCGGTSYENPFFWNQIAAAQALGMDVAAYAYLLEPTGDPGQPEDEADFLCDNLGDDWVMPIVLDCEEANSRFPDLNDYYDRYQARVIARMTTQPLIYTGNYWVQQNRLYRPSLGKMGLWIASWQDTPPPVPTNGPWDKYILWQNDAHTRVANLTECDVDIFDGDKAAWRALGRPEAGDGKIVQIRPDILPKVYDYTFPQTGQSIHPYFWDTWELGQHGYPLGPACTYTDKRVRQMFENCVLGSNGRDEPDTYEGLGQAYFAKTGFNIADWPTVHPLVSAEYKF